VRAWWSLSFLVLALLLAFPATAQEKVATRKAEFSWNEQGTALYVSLAFGDVVDPEISDKLSRGLPTKLLLTGMLFVAGSDVPVASTYQSCKVTWHVWEEMYRVEFATPEQPNTKRHWTPTLAGVLRRCAEARNLLVADRSQVSPGQAVLLKATVRVNPISEELLSKLKHWVSLPSRNATASPGSDLFSTFTGLFMQRIGDAERTLIFQTSQEVPR
jgi:hypothetical protein